MITVSEGTPASRRESNANKVTGTLIKTASTLLGMGSLEKTKMYIRKIEAQTVYSLTPEEGELELEIISNESAPLELAMNTVKETAAKIGEEAGLKAETAPLSFIPPGNPENSDVLRETLRRLLKEQHIKARDETSADPASFFSCEGIPALSLGIALGREGAEQEFINIDSIDKGRRVLERLIAETGTLEELPQAQEG
jgi:acetylornithine deacetylase/succinyl-diaminopimelate desuccinylase-like protein